MEVNDAHHSPTQRGGGGGVSKECVYACVSQCLLGHPSLSRCDLISTELRLP